WALPICRSASLARRRAGPHRRASRSPDRRALALELAEGNRFAGSRGLSVRGRSAGLSDAERVVTAIRCQQFIDAVLKPRLLPAIRPSRFNYSIDILGKWH